MAQRIDAETFTDESCGGADLDDMTNVGETFLGTEVPPQFDALRSDTTLVTIGIAGNDASLADAAIDCLDILPVPLGPPPFGRPCSGTGTRCPPRATAVGPPCPCCHPTCTTSAPGFGS